MTAHPMTSTERDLPEDKLLPCPFCGGHARVHRWANGQKPPDVSYLANCDDCEASTGDHCDTEADAIAAWNKRTDADALASIRAERDAAVAASVADVVAERERQKAVEGWTPEHDDEHKDGELARAAACYALGTPVRHKWPWGAEWWKPGDRRRNLVKAGALILAEIDRLDRAARAIAGEQKP